MTDMEMVINTLEEIKTQTAEIGLDSAVIAHMFIDKIMNVLKEQKGTINELQNAYDYLQKLFFEAQDKLLNEQKEVPVMKRKIMHMLVWCCGSCGVAITDGDKFCRMCGRKVKWDVHG